MLSVLSLDEANKNKSDYTHCVSIGDDDSCHVTDFSGDIFKIKFLDIEFLDSKNCPKREHVEQLAEYFKKFIVNRKKDDKLLIHCFAGISRSAASAVLFLLLDGNSIDETYKKLREIRPIASPNRLLIEYIDDYLGLGGKLFEANELNDQRMML